MAERVYVIGVESHHVVLAQVPTSFLRRRGSSQQGKLEVHGSSSSKLQCEKSHAANHHRSGAGGSVV
jgi:hypothetical protein